MSGNRKPRRAAMAALALVAAVAVFAVAPPGAAVVAPPRTAGRSGQQTEVPWTVGETFEYRLKFGIFNVGHGTMQVLGIDTIRGEPCYHIQFTIHAHALFYTLDDSLRSWFGVNDLVSRRFAQDTNDNGTRRSHHYEIYPELRMWIRDDKDTAETVADPLDDASFFFFARTLPYEDGKTYTFPRYFAANRNPVTIRVLGRQSIGVPAGHFNAIAVRPIFQSGGMFSEGGEAVIWFSDDSLRIPLRIRARMAIGTLDISLRSHT